MSVFVRSGLLGLMLVVATSSPLLAEDKLEQPTKADQELLEQVAKRLLAKMDPVPEFSWPPEFSVIPAKEINAYASASPKNKFFPDAKRKAYIRVTVPMMRKVVRRDDDVLALVVGHELGHLYHKHVLKGDQGDTKFVKLTYGRNFEFEADAFGAELMLKAGYSLKAGIKGERRIKGSGFSRRHAALDRLTTTHPGWNERFLRMSKEPKYWRAMSDFENGVAFLMAEQYPSAIRCFEQVTRDFPSAYDAWVNLGYARLMHYCDKLRDEDITRMDVGHVVSGGFYRRPKGIIDTRFTDEKLWFAALGALREANRLNPNLALAKANLALAYLLHPDTKDVGEAARLLQEAIDLVKEDKTLDPIARAMLLVNLGVAQISGEQRAEGLKMLEEGMTLVKALDARQSQPVVDAVMYNRAYARSLSGKAEDRKEAIGLFETYLTKSDYRSAWWSIAHEKYSRLCALEKREPKAQGELKKGRPTSFRMQTSLIVSKGKVVSLSEPTKSVLPLFAKPTVTPIAKTDFERLVFVKEGFELIASEERIKAIVLRSAKSPALKLRPVGVSGAPSVELKVGMSWKELAAALPHPEDYVFRELTQKGKIYYYYRNLGVAVLWDKPVPHGKIAELVIVRIPD